MECWRVTVLGATGAGKTALAMRFSLQCFVETYYPDLEDGFRKQIMVDNDMCFIDVIDTAGPNEYATLRDRWIREGQGFLLVYSIASRLTFEQIEMFHEQMQRVKRGSNPIFILVGNASDKGYKREVSSKEGAALASRFGCEFLETSAKTGHNVERLFVDLVRSLRQRRDIFGQPGLATQKNDRRVEKCLIM
ncbi:ras protein [Crassisporium funariophilum]|nr:ras protein [Crassisporium funariophilum]